METTGQVNVTTTTTNTTQQPSIVQQVVDKTKEIIHTVSDKVQATFSKNEPLNTVSDFYLSKLTGLWYEVARLDNFVESDLVNVTYTFNLNEDGKTLKLTVSGNENAATGEKKSYEAKVVPQESPSRLSVEFVKIFSIDYCILDSASDNSYILIGSENRKFAWILSKNASLSDDVRKELIKKLDVNGFNIDKINYTVNNIEQ